MTHPVEEHRINANVAISQIARAAERGEFGALEALNGVARAADELVADAVAEQRTHGTTWVQIAEELGISRQLAQYRYDRGAVEHTGPVCGVCGMSHPDRATCMEPRS